MSQSPSSESVQTAHELGNLLELLRSNQSLSSQLFHTPIKSLPESLQDEGFDFDLIVAYLRDPLMIEINGDPSLMSDGLTGLLDKSISELEQDHPKLVKKLISTLNNLSIQEDHSLLSTAGGSSHFSDWKQHPMRTWKPDSDRSKKEKAENIGVDVGEIGLIGLGAGIGYGLYRCFKGGATPEERPGQRIYAVAVNRGDNPHEPYFTDMNTIIRENSPNFKQNRRANVIKANRNWGKLWNNLATENDKPRLVDFNKHVNIRRIRMNIKGSNNQSRLHLSERIQDSIGSLRTNPSGLSPKQLKFETAMPEPLKNSVRLARSLDGNYKYKIRTGVPENEVKELVIPFTRSGRVEPKFNTNERTGPGKSILKKPNNRSETDWKRLYNATQNVDLDDVDVSRLSREIGRTAAALDTKVTNAVQPNPSHQAGDWKSDRSDSLLENRPDFKSDLLADESDLSEDVSKAAQKAERDIITDIANTESGIVDAAEDLE